MPERGVLGKLFQFLNFCMQPIGYENVIYFHDSHTVELLLRRIASMSFPKLKASWAQ